MLQHGSDGEERECYERNLSEHSAERNTDHLNCTACPKSLSYFHQTLYTVKHAGIVRTYLRGHLSFISDRKDLPLILKKISDYDYAARYLLFFPLFHEWSLLFKLETIILINFNASISNIIANAFF